MKVKDLIKLLEIADQEAYVHISTDKRYEEDINRVNQYEDEDSKVVLLSNWTVK